LITGSDRDPLRHLFLRVEEAMDGSGVWTVELFECRGRRGEAGKVLRRFDGEADARRAVDLVCRLSRYLVPLPTWEAQRCEQGRWRLRAYDPA
jgi:hypothetical protein